MGVKISYRACKDLRRNGSLSGLKRSKKTANKEGTKTIKQSPRRKPRILETVNRPFGMSPHLLLEIGPSSIGPRTLKKEAKSGNSSLFCLFENLEYVV